MDNVLTDRAQSDHFPVALHGDGSTSPLPTGPKVKKGGALLFTPHLQTFTLPLPAKASATRLYEPPTFLVTIDHQPHTEDRQPFSLFHIRHLVGKPGSSSTESQLTDLLNPVGLVSFPSDSPKSRNLVRIVPHQKSQTPVAQHPTVSLLRSLPLHLFLSLRLLARVLHVLSPSLDHTVDLKASTFYLLLLRKPNASHHPPQPSSSVEEKHTVLSWHQGLQTQLCTERFRSRIFLVLCRPPLPFSSGTAPTSTALFKTPTHPPNPKPSISEDNNSSYLSEKTEALR